MFRTIRGARLSALTAVCGSERLSTLEYGTALGVPPECLRRFIRGSGITSLSFLPRPYCTGDLMLQAAQSLLLGHAIDPQSVDGLLCVTQCPDQLFPGTAWGLQPALGLPEHCLIADYTYGCPGFVLGLLHAAALINTGVCRRVLLLCADLGEHEAPAGAQFESALLFGSAAAAALLESEPSATLHFSLSAHGELGDAVSAPASGWRAIRDPKNCSAAGLSLSGETLEVFALDTLAALMGQFLKHLGLTPKDIPLCLTQQSGRALLAALRAVSDFTPEQLPFRAAELGNLSSASVPTLITQLQGDARLKNNVILAAYGVGLCAALCFLDLSRTAVYPLRDFKPDGICLCRRDHV